MLLNCVVSVMKRITTKFLNRVVFDPLTRDKAKINGEQNGKGLLCSPNEVWEHIVFTLFLLIIILFFLLSSLNLFVRECSRKTTQYMKLKPF